MELDDVAIKEFQRLYFQEYDIRLTKQEAVVYGTRLVQLVKVVYGNDLPKNVAISIKKQDN